MRTLRLPTVLPYPCLFALFASLLPAQEGGRQGTGGTNQEQPAREGRRARAAGEQGPGPGQRGRRPTVVIEAGTVHPVSGPAIQNGVVVIRGNRIAAVGKQGEVEIPEGATKRSYPDGHVYPGLVDAQTDAFTDPLLRGDGSLDGGSQLRDDLRPQNPRDDALAAAGITTAYVTVRSPAQVRGQGAIVRPRGEGFEFWPEKEAVALQMRLTNGPSPTHALQRLAQFEAAGKLFEGIDEYRKAKKDWTEALLKYEKDLKEYLEHHEKKQAAGGEAKAGTQPGGAPATEPPGSGNRPQRPTRQRPPEGGGGSSDAPSLASEQPAGDAAAVEAALLALIEALAPQDPPPPAPRPGPQGQGPQGRQGPPANAPQAQENKDAGPKRPTYPKKPPEDPTKEALLRVLDGELALRIEAHRADEVRAALAMQKKHGIPLLVVEQAYGAAAAAATVAEQGAMVVLTEVLPGRQQKVYEGLDPAATAAALQAAGAPFAIASGSARRAASLPLMAATAVAAGLDESAALRAITLTPAEILGVAKDTGSLTAGKYADVLVTDRPLLASDSRVLLVLSQGRTEFEAK